MNMKCIALNVTETGVGEAKAPTFTATLEPIDGGPTIRVTGGAGSAAATMAYGQSYSLNLI